jgi:hypothetical protein
MSWLKRLFSGHDDATPSSLGAGPEFWFRFEAVPIEPDCGVCGEPAEAVMAALDSREMDFDSEFLCGTHAADRQSEVGGPLRSAAAPLVRTCAFTDGPDNPSCGEPATHVVIPAILTPTGELRITPLSQCDRHYAEAKARVERSRGGLT